MSLSPPDSAVPGYAVIGNPVAHSRSPTIHQLFAKATGQNLTYGRLHAPVDRFAETIAAFRATGGMGLSVTLPFKLECLALAHEASPRARSAGAANTLAWQSGHWYADNTDGAGLQQDLARNLAFDARDRDVLVIGAGGAARGILAPLLAQAPRRLVIVNRTHDKAAALAAQFAGRAAASTTLRACRIDQLHGDRFDVVINASSAGLTSADDALPWPERLFTEDALAYDLTYAAGPTPFLRWAALQGAARCADGLGMLVEQAALQFQLWRGILPATGPVLAQLRAELKP